MDLLVTGGAGFVGANLCRALRTCTEVGRIVVLDDLSTGLAPNLSGVADVELVVGSVTNGTLVDDLVRQVDAVLHLAAIPAVARSIENPPASHDVNVTGTVTVLEAARRHGGRHVVVASSSSVYGARPSLPASEDQPARPVSPYAAGKLAAESYALAYAHSFGVPVLTLRFFNVFGPLQRADHAYAAVVPAFVAAACADRPLTVHGDGTQTRDFTFVGDVTRVLLAAVSRRVTAPTPVNLAFGTRTSLLALIDALADILGRPLERAHTPPRVGDVPHSQADNSRLLALFPDLQPVPLVDGLRATVDWFGTTGHTAQVEPSGS